MKKPRRLQFFVDMEVQYGLIRKLLLHWTLFLLANGIALLLWIRLFDAPESDWGATTTRFVGSYLPVLVVSLALLPVFLLDTIRLSNRFSGPILRFRQAMAAWANGSKVEKVHFRNGDFWQSLATDFNAVVDKQQPSQGEGKDATDTK